MKVLGIGTDIIEIRRVRQAVEKNPRIVERLFTKLEHEDFLARGGRWESLAGKFAAKEACVKALGSGLRGFRWTDIEILPDELGKPVVSLWNQAKDKAELQGIQVMMVSISHHQTDAIAFVIAQG